MLSKKVLKISRNSSLSSNTGQWAKYTLKRKEKIDNNSNNGITGDWKFWKITDRLSVRSTRVLMRKWISRWKTLIFISNFSKTGPINNKSTWKTPLKTINSSQISRWMPGFIWPHRPSLIKLIVNSMQSMKVQYLSWSSSSDKKLSKICLRTITSMTIKRKWSAFGNKYLV